MISGLNGVLIDCHGAGKMGHAGATLCSHHEGHEVNEENTGLTTKDTKRHEKKPMPFHHEGHEVGNQGIHVLSRDCGKFTEDTERKTVSLHECGRVRVHAMTHVLLS